ncbi:hypothetical protein EVAR_25066_1 [Eumeta japonica]|uniref:Uncharacterized protein n=1 Tax=Eumeta variegata TaxID=151549 RepID=A0A4C1V829_EUMVA|nr:hypothetical protein EVAR_25066_1 [Eumeta japonica]
MICRLVSGRSVTRLAEEHASHYRAGDHHRHGYSQPQTSHRCVASLLEGNRISDGGGEWAIGSSRKEWDN